MDALNKFSIKRLWLLIKRNAVLNQKTWLLGFAASAGVLILISLFITYRWGGNLNLEALVVIGHFLIFIEGFLLTSKVFHELQTPARSQYFLTLPAKTSEKVVANWLLSSIIYIVAAYIGLFLVLVASSLLNAAIFGSQIEIYNLLTIEQIELIGHYLVLQTIFFLGSVYFRKNNFLNTVLSVIVIGKILSIWTWFLAWMLLVPYFPATTNFQIDTWINLESETLFSIIYWGLIAPFFLIVSYFTLKEREI